MAKVLFAGESWSSYSINVKGFNAYNIGGYGEGGKPLIDALQSEGHEVTYLRNHEAIEQFPRTVEELKEYDVVVFSDMGADTLLLPPAVLLDGQVRPNPLVSVREFVRQGGGFLMVGGYMSFSGFEGRAHYKNTALAEVLPVELLGYDDRVERPEGCTPQVVSAHPILEGIPAEWPLFLGYNRIAAKPGAQVLLQVDNDSFLTVGNYGQGRVAAFASDCSPHWGTVQFTDWEYYPKFWGQLIKWLAGK
ncbi:MAG TPA: glutamine amidotransferase [Limnochordia bacterium]|jgi:uncharacterized membrane protein|nr:glutamine amidotransferase [Limnochordia bacterium]